MWPCRIRLVLAVQTALWLYVAFDRCLTDARTLCVPLSRPRRAVATEYLSLSTASFALALAAYWSNLTFF